jgi:DNA end-binding protein Ku
VPSAIWTGTISFGLVTVPVRAVSATRSRDVRFNQLEASTGARIRYRRVSEQSGDEVPNDRIVKGYEVSPGQYVTIDDDEMKQLAPKASRTIDIEDFVDLDEIDPVYFEQPYYLAPDPNALKPYRLLVDAMTEGRKVAVGRFVMRAKEHLVAIRPVDGVLCLETMRYADEIVPVADVIPPIEEGDEPSERELTMARQLVESLTAEFEPGKYHDAYREEVLALIERKAAGEEIVARPEVEETGKVLDLMAALQASLARAGHPPGEPAEAPAEAPAEGTRAERAASAGSRRARAVKRSPAEVSAKKATGKAAAPRKAAKSAAKRSAAKAEPAKQTRAKRSA